MSHYVFLMKGVYFMEKKTLYFLCTGNSCRSQMAEGFAKKYLSDWNIKSAGIEAHGLNPMAVKAMAEVGIDISNQTSDTIDHNILNNATLVVTDDPAKASGTEEEKWLVFKTVRDAIEERIRLFAREKN